MAAVVALLLLPPQGRRCFFLSLLMLSIRPQEVRKPSLLSFPLSLFSSTIAVEKRSPTSLIRALSRDFQYRRLNESSQLHFADTRIEEEPLDFSIFFEFKRNKPSDFSLLSSKTCRQPLLLISSLLNRNPFPSFLPRFVSASLSKKIGDHWFEKTLPSLTLFPTLIIATPPFSSRNRFFPPPFLFSDPHSLFQNRTSSSVRVLQPLILPKDKK
ncbi:hypothetical protein NE237_009638 [Protea cynaroides]|uniref:Uncharacterized protein n=1 Tax=Protea cynaroides TaxID=273540 RepID=A0A9Q0KY14_9MAGN|nr:hypothetical protein NE237_009638 [Protea cynaroides]